MPVKKSSFNVALCSDTELHTLLQVTQDEIAKREDNRKRRRKEWICRYYNEAVYNAAIEVVGETVIVAILKNGHIHMTKTHPIDGDVFDVKTGVAVAYCKAIGLRIPDFI